MTNPTLDGPPPTGTPEPTPAATKPTARSIAAIAADIDESHKWLSEERARLDALEAEMHDAMKARRKGAR